MRILYLQSGYGRIYQSFDKSIVKACKALNYPTIFDSYQNALATIMKNKLNHQDIMITMLGFKIPPHILKECKKRGIQTAVWLTEDPYYIDRTLKQIFHYDYIFSIDTAAVSTYKKAGHQNVHYLPLGSDPDIYKPVHQTESLTDLSLVGYPYPDRVELINFLLTHTPYSIQLVGGKWKEYINDLNMYKTLSIHPHWVTPRKANKYFNQAKINLNTHRPFNLAQNENTLQILNESVNNRTFDIATAQGFQLIDNKTDVGKHFEEGKEIISFSTKEDLVRKIDHFLTHNEERKQIAKASYEKAMNKHTFTHRLKEMVTNIILAEMK
ncbi:glycosyltransferase [Alkalihalophilus pseudofirmus]|uniref:CgeB family protein n=1 Tax=Alkalihalophilus pseudofirmus TaxID=79885 RepID=UPI00259BEB13|nr:glycosyltransferase [Alkalihalophilus pseudofirmus]WEG15358.1 glycosyltransferase [Alkalihalophilus pseudofirmus]